MVQCGIVRYVFIPYTVSHCLYCACWSISHKGTTSQKQIPSHYIKKKSSFKIATYPKHMYITLHLSTFFWVMVEVKKSARGYHICNLHYFPFLFFSRSPYVTFLCVWYEENQNTDRSFYLLFDVWIFNLFKSKWLARWEKESYVFKLWIIYY